METKTFGKRSLYVTADEVHGALRRRGPAEDRDEVIVDLFAVTLADMIEHGGTFAVTVTNGAARIIKV